MVKAPVLSEILKLSVAERLELISDVWDSIDDAAEIPVPQWQKDELDRRLKDDAANPNDGMSLQEFRERLAKRR